MISRIATIRFQQKDVPSCSLPSERERDVRRAGIRRCADSVRLDRALRFNSRFELLFAADPFLPFKAVLK